MKPEESEVLSEGVSRRRMLKRIGAGAAVAWTAPILTSIRTPAFAATPTGCSGCPADGCPGSDFQPCGDGGCTEGACTGGLGCFIHENTEGDCVCLQNVFCSCVVACSSSADCASGCCIPNTGCGSGGVCVDCCGQNCRDSVSGKKVSGKTARK
jgi:hypothetical protein